MQRGLMSLLEESVALAEVQLEAARSLDADGLMAATKRRQDLVFEIDSWSDEALKKAATEETQESALELAELDRRLARITGAALQTFQRLLPDQGPDVYASDGRVKGGAP